MRKPSRRCITLGCQLRFSSGVLPGYEIGAAICLTTSEMEGPHRSDKQHGIFRWPYASTPSTILHLYESCLKGAVSLN